MCKHTSFLITAVVGLAALLAPAVGAHYLAERYGESEQMARAGRIVDEVVRRTEQTSARMAEVFARLENLRRDDPCSEDMIRTMESIDATSYELQAVGHVADDRLACSSLGPDMQGMALGKPEFISATQVAVRRRIPRQPAVSLLAVTDTSSGFTAFVHPKLPIDVYAGDAHVSVGILSGSGHGVLLSRGAFSRAWLAPLGRRAGVSFMTDTHVVAMRRSARFDTIAYAALPVAAVHAHAARLKKILVPIGLVAGISFAAAAILFLRRQRAMPALIRQGLKRKEFYLEYQPIVHLQTGQWVGAEALLRWRRRNGEQIRPDLFIPAAEEAGLIGKLTERVCELVRQDAAGLFARHPDCRLSINLSAQDMHSVETVERLTALAAATGAGPGNLVVEATERGFMQADLAREIVAGLREQGFKVAIDDFGTGYSSLSYLESFEMDYLKIDKWFIDTIDTDAPTSHVVSHIIELAKDLKLMMVAEGVETVEQARFLGSRGVQFAQGWLFAKSMPFDEFLRRFQEHSAGPHSCAQLFGGERLQA